MDGQYSKHEAQLLSLIVLLRIIMGVDVIQFSP